MTILLQKVHYDDASMTCFVNAPIWAYGFIIIIDLIISLACLYLFVKKLTQIKLLILSNNDPNNAKLINGMIIKGIISTGLSIATSTLFITSFIITRTTFGMGIEYLANYIGMRIYIYRSQTGCNIFILYYHICTALMLLREDCNDIYLKLCGRCHSLGVKLTYSKANNVVMLNTVVEKSKTKNPSLTAVEMPIEIPTVLPNIVPNFTGNYSTDIIFKHELEVRNSNEAKERFKHTNTDSIPPPLNRSLTNESDISSNADLITPGYEGKMMEHVSYYIDQISAKNICMGEISTIIESPISPPKYNEIIIKNDVETAGNIPNDAVISENIETKGQTIQ